jgi:hypothetical protein
MRERRRGGVYYAGRLASFAAFRQIRAQNHTYRREADRHTGTAQGGRQRGSSLPPIAGHMEARPIGRGHASTIVSPLRPARTVRPVLPGRDRSFALMSCRTRPTTQARQVVPRTERRQSLDSANRIRYWALQLR